MPSILTVLLVSLLLVTPAVLFWLWLMILPVRLVEICPEECSCEREGYIVNCSDSRLNSIPSILPTHAQTLVLDGNNISFFENDSFISRGMGELLIINADFCKIRKIQLGAFNGLRKLTRLSIQGNEISEIIPGTFEKSSHLEYLYLHYNKIEHLESDVFCGMVELKYVSLEGNNLQYIHPDTFEGLQNLESIFLSRNSGLQIPTDRHFINSRSLNRLDISHCYITSVSVETFANVSALKWLDLSYNNLRSFDINILTVLPKLSKLYLSRNEIREIVPGTLETFSYLEYLQLDYNKIEHLESDVFGGLVKLIYINLQGNELQYLHPDTFSGLPKLQDLHLMENLGLQIPTDRHFINSHSLKYLGMSYCNVNSVSVETFANVSALEGLSLSYNNLRSLDINILKTLTKLLVLSLDGNRLQCDCQLQEVWRWCQDHNIQTAYKEIAPECDTPSEVKGMWWGVLEKGQCLEGNIQYYGDYKNTNCSYTLTEDKEKEQQEKVFAFYKPYKFPVSVVLFIFGATGNVILIIIITCNKDMRTVPNMYILNLAISDIIHLMVLFLEVSVNEIPGSSPFDDSMCTLYSFCYRMSVGLSAYSVAMLSIQRYRVTVNPFHVHVSSKRTWRATVATICGVWIVAALFSLPAALSRNLCLGSIFLFFNHYYQLLALFYLFVFCVLAVSVIAFSYIMTACHLLESSTLISEETQNPQLNKRKNTAKVVLGLTVVFLISYVPYQIFEMYLFSRKNLDVSIAQFPDELGVFDGLEEIEPIANLLVPLNPCLNPVALFCTSLAFRRQFKRYLTCCCKTKSPPTDFELTRST